MVPFKAIHTSIVTLNKDIHKEKMTVTIIFLDDDNLHFYVVKGHYRHDQQGMESER